METCHQKLKGKIRKEWKASCSNDCVNEIHATCLCVRMKARAHVETREQDSGVWGGRSVVLGFEAPVPHEQNQMMHSDLHCLSSRFLLGNSIPVHIFFPNKTVSGFHISFVFILPLLSVILEINKN